MGTSNTLTGLFGSGWREVEFENSDDIPDKEDSMKKKHLQPLTPAALYARVSSDRQDVKGGEIMYHLGGRALRCGV